MEFEDSFDVPTSKADTWNVLTDIERVYPCLPGAELEEIAENRFKGMVTLRLGPVTAAYRGSAHFEDLDEENGTLTIIAEGRDKHGQGTARARIEARLTEEGEGSTRVSMHNNIEITGKAAQFGRGIIVDVSREIMGQFADSLKAVVIGPANGPGNGPASAQPTGAPPPPAADAGLDVLDLGRKVAARRIRESPLVAVAIAVVLVWLIARHSRR